MKKTLFIIEDEKLIRETFYDYFTYWDYNVLTAENGLEGLEKIQSYINDGKKIDLVLSDIHMPKMNGIEMLKKLKSNQYELPFIFITGYCDFKEKLLIEKNVRDVLFKPVELKQLLSVVEECLMH